jgi:hypothetical protein
MDDQIRRLEKPKLYAIVRLSLDRAQPLDAEHANWYIKVVRVFSDCGAAEADADRLNALNGTDNVYYFVSKANNGDLDEPDAPSESPA